MQSITIYHNPRCSKSRKALELIRQRNRTPVVIHYLNNPLQLHQLQHLKGLLQISARQMLRKNETAYAEYNLDDLQMDDDAIFRVVEANPILLQRPVVVSGNVAVIARPPEKVFDLPGFEEV